ncbi:MAG: SOS response-associated peptidase [archaeon]
MCGRFSMTARKDIIAERFNIGIPFELSPRYNIAPSQECPVVLSESPKTLSMCTWGMTPCWAKNAMGMINARAETLEEKPAYRDAFKNKRCLVIADGFYEWKLTPAGKVPYRIMQKDGLPFAFAGIYDRWQDRLAFAIITVEPNSVVRQVHDRMPAILGREEETHWLQQGAPQRLKSMLTPFPGDLEIYKVPPAINDTGNDNADIIKPLTDLTSFF